MSKYSCKCGKRILSVEIKKKYWCLTKYWQNLGVTLTFWPQNALASSSHHPSSMYEIWKLHVANYSSYRVRTKVLTKFRCDLDLFDPKMYGYLHTILHLCMKYEGCTLKTTQVIVSEPKCWQSLGVTLTFRPHNVFESFSHHPAYIYEIWTLYVENWSSNHARTKVLTKFRCDLDL